MGPLRENDVTFYDGVTMTMFQPNLPFWGMIMTKSRSISTVEGSGATCTRIFFEFFFFKTGDLFMVHLTQKIQKREKNAKNACPGPKGTVFIHL